MTPANARRPERRAPATALLLSNMFGMLVPVGVAHTRPLDEGAGALAGEKRTARRAKAQLPQHRAGQRRLERLARASERSARGAPIVSITMRRFDDAARAMAQARQQIRFCSAHDGVRIAYATSGRGPLLVKVANWLSHLEYDWESPVWRPLLDELSRDHTLVRYDERGCGLSDWNVADLSFDAWVHDLETVVEAAGVDRFPLLGISQGASIACAYAVRHPERVTHLVLHGGYTRGRLRRAKTPQQRDEAEMMIRLAEIGWGRENPAFRQFFTTQFIPDGSPEQHRWWNELVRISTSPANAARIMRNFGEIDVGDLLPRVACPTLVLHATHDARVPFEEGRMLAGLIPGARFVPIESNNHVLLDSEPGWQRWLDEVRAFLPHASSADPAFARLTQRERALLELIAQGRDNAQIAAHLGLSEKTVRNHITSIFAKLEVDNRARAIVVARTAGYGTGAG